jgi:replication factor A1
LNGEVGKSKFYKISGFVQHIFNDDKIMYLSCPDCRKKVTEEHGLWNCEACHKTHTTNVPTFMLGALIADASGSVVVQFARELGDPILQDTSAAQYKQLKELGDTKSFISGC